MHTCRAVLHRSVAASFSNNYVRPLVGLPQQPSGIFQLGSYMAFWAMAYLAVTVYVAVFQREVGGSQILRSRGGGAWWGRARADSLRQRPRL